MTRFEADDKGLPAFPSPGDPMSTPAPIVRPLGTMVAYGFPRTDVAVDLGIASRIGAKLLEILPHWRSRPDPLELKARIGDSGLQVWSVHGGWGGQAILSPRIDLGSSDPLIWLASVDDLKRCLDWLFDVGGSHLVVHPGGLSDLEESDGRRSALIRGLHALADHVGVSGLTLCVENMPPGVHPGSLMSEVASIVAEVDRREVRIALDTGHANLVSSAPTETLAAGSFLATTHVHDNNGRTDSHLPPGSGTIDWVSWIKSLDQVEYRGPIMLECIRHLRENPATFDPEWIEFLKQPGEKANDRTG